MKILFICGCLEPGRDGVGDYTRRLATELSELGFEVFSISAYDKYVTEPLTITGQLPGTSISICRIPYNWPNRKRFEVLRTEIETIDPDLINLQYVPFAFQSKGVPVVFINRLKKIGVERNWEIMFHELWVGMELNASLSHKILGSFQRMLVRYLIRVVKPVQLYTQSKIYQAQLSKLGIKSEYLPLFGNIPVTNTRTFVNKDANGCEGDANIISFVLFGAIHPLAPVASFAKEAREYEIHHGVKIILTLIGRSGPEHGLWAKEWQDAGLALDLQGEQSAKIVSKTLAAATFGLSTTPLALADKSGSIAAMREHGLPVICVCHPWIARDALSFTAPLGVFEYRENNFAELIQQPAEVREHTGARSVALRLSIMYSGPINAEEPFSTKNAPYASMAIGEKTIK